MLLNLVYLFFVVELLLLAYLVMESMLVTSLFIPQLIMALFCTISSLQITMLNLNVFLDTRFMSSAAETANCLPKSVFFSSFQLPNYSTLSILFCTKVKPFDWVLVSEVRSNLCHFWAKAFKKRAYILHALLPFSVVWMQINQEDLEDCGCNKVEEDLDSESSHGRESVTHFKLSCN